MTIAELFALLAQSVHYTDLYSWVIACCNYLYSHYVPGAGSDGASAAWDNVLHLRAFAGQYWSNETGDRAAWYAIIIDNLIDLIDTANVRGDH